MAIGFTPLPLATAAVTTPTTPFTKVDEIRAVVAYYVLDEPHLAQRTTAIAPPGPILEAVNEVRPQSLWPVIDEPRVPFPVMTPSHPIERVDEIRPPIMWRVLDEPRRPFPVVTPQHPIARVDEIGRPRLGTVIVDEPRIPRIVSAVVQPPWGWASHDFVGEHLRWGIVLDEVHAIGLPSIFIPPSPVMAAIRAPGGIPRWRFQGIARAPETR